MASLNTCAPPSHSIGIFRRPSPGISAPFLTLVTSAHHNLNATLNLRLKKELKLRVKKRWSPVSASNTNPSETDDTKSSNDGSSPPLLTILFGVIVFLLISWVLGSIVMWIISLILHPPQSG